MGLFGRKKERIVDWSGNYKMQEKRASGKKEDSGLGFLGDMANSTSSSNISWDNDVPLQHEPEKKQKLAKRLLDMTGRIEDLNNQIYHLKQRIELLERKLKVRIE
jgi:uncharacterized protein YceH (UPF0502 family)